MYRDDRYREDRNREDRYRPDRRGDDYRNDRRPNEDRKPFETNRYEPEAPESPRQTSEERRAMIAKWEEEETTQPQRSPRKASEQAEYRGEKMPEAASSPLPQELQTTD